MAQIQMAASKFDSESSQILWMKSFAAILINLYV